MVKNWKKTILKMVPKNDKKVLKNSEKLEYI